MYYLAKFCRICIRTGVNLVDIETYDFDTIKYSEKLAKCTKMVITRESLSTEICTDCVKKLRVSYDFQKMCIHSSKILQGYLTELISTSTKVTPENFINSDLRVTVSPLNTDKFHDNNNKRKRITKIERCSILKKLLSTNNNNNVKQTGGLKTIIEFTKNYDFGYKKTTPEITTPLNQLANFTNNFFSNNFNDFNNTILYLIENCNNLNNEESDTDEEMFEDNEEETHPLIEKIKCEELVVEPDIKIKTEFEETDYENPYKPPYEPLPPPPGPPFFNPYFYSQENSSSLPVDLLDKLVQKFNQGRTFPQYSVRCRTRGNPYINPHLRHQFQMRSFQCDKCNRYFKSPGYLKAHASKVHI